MQVSKQLSLANLAKILAGSNPEFKNFHAKVFSFIPTSEEDFISVMKGIDLHRDAMPNKHPCSFFVGDISTAIQHQTSLIPTITEQGELQIQIRLDAAKLPTCHYLTLVSPYIEADGKSSYSAAFESINFVRAIIALFFGKLPFYSQVAEFDFDVEGRIGQSTQAFRLPLYSDHFAIKNSDIASDILGRLKHQQDEYRNRIQRASNFFSNAINQKDEAFRFASYWIALEVLVGSTGDAIRQALRRAYGYENKHAVDELLYFKEVSDARHQLIHKGVFGVLPAFYERLLQLYFWDIIISQVNLPCRQLARSLVTSGMIEAEKTRAV